MQPTQDDGDDAVDFEQHQAQIRDIFTQYEQQNSPLANGMIGITYDQFRDYFKQHMNVTFDNDADFFEICEELDPELTHRIQFDRLIAKLTEPQSDDDDIVDAIANDETPGRGSTPGQGPTPGRGSDAQEGLITVEKLTEIRQIFEQNLEPIPDSELSFDKTDAKNAEYRVNLIKIRQYIDQIENLIKTKSVVYNKKTDLRLADFNILFAEFLQRRNNQSDNSPLYITNIEFSECISAFEMKIYNGNLVTQQISESFKDQIRGTVIDDIVLGSGQDTDRASDYDVGGSVTSRETRSMIIYQLQQISTQNRGNNLEILKDLMMDFSRNQRWTTYMETADADNEWRSFFSLLSQSIDTIHSSSNMMEQVASGKQDKLSNLEQQSRGQEDTIKDLRATIAQLQRQYDTQFDEVQKLTFKLKNMEKEREQQWQLENKIGQIEDQLLLKSNEAQKYRNQLDILRQENSEYARKVSNLQLDVEALSFALKDEQGFKDVKDNMSAQKGELIYERLKKLGVLVENHEPKIQGRQRLDTISRNDVLSQLDKKINLKDKLNRKEEEAHLKVLEQMVTTDIQDKEREALLAIRKEIMRKQMYLDRTFKDMNKLNRHIDKKEKELEQIANHLIKKDELAKQYKRVIDKMQRENLQLMNRGTMLEAKMKFNEISRKNTIVSGQDQFQPSLPGSQPVSFPVSRSASIIDNDHFLTEDQIHEAFAKAADQHIGHLHKIKSQVSDIETAFANDQDEANQYIKQLKQAQKGTRGNDSSIDDRISSLQSPQIQDRMHTVTGLNLNENDFGLDKRNPSAFEPSPLGQKNFQSSESGFGDLPELNRNQSDNDHLYRDTQLPSRDIRAPSTFGDLVAKQQKELSQPEVDNQQIEDLSSDQIIKVPVMTFEKRPDMSHYYKQDDKGLPVIDQQKYIDQPEPDADEKTGTQSQEQPGQQITSDYLQKVQEVIIQGQQDSKSMLSVMDGAINPEVTLAGNYNQQNKLIFDEKSLQKLDSFAREADRLQEYQNTVSFKGIPESNVEGATLNEKQLQEEIIMLRNTIEQLKAEKNNNTSAKISQNKEMPDSKGQINQQTSHSKLQHKEQPNLLDDPQVKGLHRETQSINSKKEQQDQKRSNRKENKIEAATAQFDLGATNVRSGDKQAGNSKKDKVDDDAGMAFDDSIERSMSRQSSLFDQPGGDDGNTLQIRSSNPQISKALKQSQSHVIPGQRSLNSIGQSMASKLKKKAKKTKIVQEQLEVANIRMSGLPQQALPKFKQKRTLMSHVTERMNFDHLSLFDTSNKNHANVVRILDSIQEKRQPVLAFSDEMHVYNRSSKKQRVIIIITDKYFIILTKKFSLVRKFGLVELKSIVSITSNSSIMALKFRDARRGTVAANITGMDDKTNKDIILETYRRSEFIVFLLNSADLNNRQRPNLLTANQFRIDNSLIIDFQINEDAMAGNGQSSTNMNSQPRVSRNMVQNLDSRDYLMAYKAGYLYKSSHSILRSGKWDKRFYVLCTIGLIYMKEPSQKEVKLFPFQDFKVVEIPHAKHKKPYVFEVKTIRGGTNNVILQAFSQSDYDEWIKAFAKFQTKLQLAKDQLLADNIQNE